MSYKRITPLLVALAAVFAFASTASAYCGPGFSSKKAEIAYYKTSVGKKFLPSMKNVLVRKGFMHKDQDVMAFLKSDQTVYTKTPKGYVLNFNTFCPDGANYRDYHGNYRHSRLGVLAVKYKSKVKKLSKAKKVGKATKKVVSTKEVPQPQADGSVDVYQETVTQTSQKYRQKVRQCTSYKPFQKGYCRNLVSGKKWQKCKSFVKHWVKKVKSTTRRFLRKIPAPTKNGSLTPPPPSTAPGPNPTPTPTCESGSVWSPTQNKCVKDGNTTPPTPTPAPGPNPTPDPGDPAPGGHMCYSETTGLPVDPIVVNGVTLCPPGSYGGD